MRVVMCTFMVLVCASVAWGQAITGFAGGYEYNIYHSGSTGDVIGWRFTVDVQIEISDLGVWNNDNTGCMDTPHPVGLWDGSHTLITYVIVDPTGTVVGDWIYASITPVVINPTETYTIGALYYSDDNDLYISSATSMTTDPNVTFVNSVYPATGSLGFVYPELNTSSFGRFGPNFIFTETSLENTTWGAIKASSF